MMNRPSVCLALALACAATLPTLGQAAGAAKVPSLDEYRRYAQTHEGNIARGAQLFRDDPRLSCAKCHSTDGKASKAGPDLYAVGDGYGRRDIVTSVLQPSATIAPGYGTVIVETKAGDQIQGTLKQSNDEGLQLMNAEGKLIKIAKADIQQRTGSAISLMPEGLQNGLSLAEFTDLIEYLTSLKQPANTQVSEHGMPAQIPELAKPIGITPLFSEPLTVSNTKGRAGLTAIFQVPGSPDVFLVLHQTGLIWRMQKTAKGEEKSVFSDLTGPVFYERGPNGLLGLAFHPKFRQNHKYYLQHQIFEDGTVATVIEEKEATADFMRDSGKPPRRIIKINSVAEDHSGGSLEFGADGYLYFGMGDTGPHNDPNGHAQNLKLLLGKMLRIDVDHQADGNAYAIPKDNPFRGQADVRPEIWAYGLRNPWRFSFDAKTHELWLADVGQDRVEEVDIVHRGENYGWSVFEGFEPFSNQYRVEGRKFTRPVFAYHRKYGNSITGGYVYRGDPKSSFYGVYLCGDYTSKIIFGVKQEKGELKAVRQLGKLPQGLVSFGTDEANHLYAVGYEGMIYRLDFSGADFNAVKAE